MKRLNTRAIVLARTDYGEADRILTLLTPDQGKVKGIAKGVRKSKSKMAGGIELFSVSEVSYIIGKSEINTIISTRLVKHYGNIVKDLDRTNSSYDLIKIINKATEDHPEEAYFNLLRDGLQSMDDKTVDLNLINLWFRAQLLKLAGHTPNLKTDKAGNNLKADKTYDFDFERVGFIENTSGQFGVNEIKFMRLAFGNNQPKALQKVQNSEQLASGLLPLAQAILRAHVRI
jgi:DNA repair protein RecO (recombination protein O)